MFVCIALGLRRRIWLSCALGLFVGLAVFVLASILLLSVGIPYRASSIAAALAVILAISVLSSAKQGSLTRRELEIVGVWTLGFALISFPLAHFNLSLLARDSHMFVKLGRIIGADAAFAEGMLTRLSEWGVFQPIAQSAAAFTSEEYLYGLSPQMAICFAALFPLCLRIGLKALGIEARAMWLAVFTATLFSIFHYQHHFAFIHNNLGTSIYLFGFVALFWFAEVERDVSYLPVAFLCLTACSFQRVETPVVALLFAAVFVLPSRLPARALALGFGSFVVPVVAWYGLLAGHAPRASQFLTKTRCLLLIAVVLGGYAACLLSRHARFERARQRAPELALIAIVVALVVAFALKPEHMGISARSWLRNLVSGYWGVAWPLIAMLVLGASRLPRFASSKVFGYGIAAQVGLIILLAFGRSPYRAAHVGDSANRMMMHLLPLLFFYLALKLIPLFAERRGSA